MKSRGSVTKAVKPSKVAATHKLGKRLNAMHAEDRLRHMAGRTPRLSGTVTAATPSTDPAQKRMQAAEAALRSASGRGAH